MRAVGLNPGRFDQLQYVKASFVQKKCVIPKRIIQLRHCRMILSKHLGARVCSI